MTIQVITENTTVQNASADEQFTGLVDSYIDEGTATTNYGTNTLLRNRDDGAGGNRYTMILRFDLSNLPAGATINSASLYLNKTTGGTGNTFSISLFRSRRDIVGSQVTWNLAQTGTSWTTAGAKDTTNDRVSPAESTLATTNTSGYQTWTGLASFVQGYVDGSYSFAVLIGETVTDTNFNERNFISSDGADGSRPELVIDYTESSGFKRSLVGYGGLVGPNGGLIHVG